jgi:hypothetical protein
MMSDLHVDYDAVIYASLRAAVYSGIRAEEGLNRPTIDGAGRER